MLKTIIAFITGLFKKTEEDTELSDLPLRLGNLQFFAEPGDPPADPPADPPNPEDDPEPPADPKDIMIPKTRFDEVNTKYKTVQEQLDKLLKDQEDAELEKKKQQGEFENLYNKATEDLETYKGNYEKSTTRVEQLEGIITSMLNTKLESIPEEFRDLIPENLSPEQKLDWITKADSKGLFKDKSQDPLGGATNPSGKPQDLEKLNVHQLMQGGYKN